MSSVAKKDTGDLIITFVRERQILEEYIGTIEDYWTEIYDLFSLSDLMLIRSSNGQPLTDEQAKKILSLVVEDMSDDGSPIIWKIHNGSLFLAEDLTATPFGIKAYEQYKSLLPNETLECIFDAPSIKRFDKQIQKRKSQRTNKKNYDFGGILSRDVINRKGAIHFRPRIEDMFEAAVKLENLTEYGTWLQDCILALEPIVHHNPYTRDSDLAELVGTLYDDLSMESKEEVSGDDSFMQDPLIKEWLNHVDESHHARKNVFEIKKRIGVLDVKTYNITMQDVAMALKNIEIPDGFHDWIRRTIVKLKENERLSQNPIIEQLAERQFEMLEDFVGLLLVRTKKY